MRLLNTPCERRRCKHDWTVRANSVKSLDICVKWLLKDGLMTSSLASMKLLQIVEKLWNKDIGAGGEWDEKESKEQETKTNVTNSEHIYVVTPSNHYTLWPLSRNVSLRCRVSQQNISAESLGVLWWDICTRHIQFRCIYLAPDHNSSHLKALYTVKWRAYSILEKTMTSSFNLKAFVVLMGISQLLLHLKVTEGWSLSPFRQPLYHSSQN